MYYQSPLLQNEHCRRFSFSASPAAEPSPKRVQFSPDVTAPTSALNHPFSAIGGTSPNRGPISSSTAHIAGDPSPLPAQALFQGHSTPFISSPASRNPPGMSAMAAGLPPSGGSAKKLASWRMAHLPWNRRQKKRLAFDNEERSTSNDPSGDPDGLHAVDASVIASADLTIANLTNLQKQRWNLTVRPKEWVQQTPLQASAEAAVEEPGSSTESLSSESSTYSVEPYVPHTEDQWHCGECKKRRGACVCVRRVTGTAAQTPQTD
jgi:hypothetical protein